MTAKSNTVFTPQKLCFGVGFMGVFVLAIFVFYPALLALFFGDGASGNIDETRWPLPILIMAMIMSGWFMVGFLALLQPALIGQILVGIWKQNPKSGVGASEQFKHGRTFVLGSLAGKTLIWPAVLFAGVLILLLVLGLGGWPSILASILSGLFFTALILHLIAPGLLSGFERRLTGSVPPSVWPFIWGMMISGLVLILMNGLGLLSSINTVIQAPTKQPLGEQRTVERTNDDTHAGPAIGENLRQINPGKIPEGAKHYVTWKDDEFIEIGEAFCANGMSVFLPKTKGYIGVSADPDSVVYDPYARGIGGAVGIGSSSRKGGGADTVPVEALDASAASNSAESVKDDAIAAGEIKPNAPNWVRDMGAPWGLGSVVYRGEEKLSGYDFPQGTHIFSTKAFIVSPDQPEIETEAFLVPGSCGSNINLGSSIRRELLSGLEGAVHFLPNYSGYGDSRSSDFNLITDIPVLDLQYSDGLIDEALKLIAEQGRRKGANVPPIIMVARWTREEESENRKIEEAKIRKALAARQRSNVSWVPIGQLSPLCNIPNQFCAALNQATTIYVPALPD